MGAAKIRFEGGCMVNILSSVKLKDRHQNRLRETFPHYQFTFLESIEQATTREMEETEVLITYGRELTPALLDQFPRLKWIQVLTAGLDRLPIQALEERGILLTNVRGLHGIQMAEYTMAMILNLVRRTYQFYDLQKEKRWDNTVRIDEAYGKTLGILGLGAIGEAIAQRAKAFGLRVIGLRKTPGPCPPCVDQLLTSGQEKELYAQSDFLVVLLPLTEETRHFINGEAFNQMKEGAFLINIARGPIVDEQALLEAVRQGKIAGAVLDVFDEEPLPPDHPFWTEKNIIITPHIAGRSPRYMERAMDIFVENLKAYPDLSRMKNVIDYKRGY